MRSFLATTAVLGAVAVGNAQVMFNAQTSTSNTTTSACPSQGGAHIIVARASLEAVGYGVIGVVKDQILAQVPGSTAEFVEYPATLNAYFDSETTGVLAARQLINNWSNNCPCGPLIVMGYSQGAQVTADSLIGQNVGGFPDNSSVNAPLSDSILARTAAVIMMGDPTALPNQTFHVGNATKNSIFPRRNTANFEATGLASRTQSYCDAGDPYCAAGDMLAVHLQYVQEYGTQATEFVVKGIKDFYAKQSGSCVNSASNGTASGVAPTGTAPSTRRPSASGTAPVTRASGSGVVVAPTGTGYAAPTGTGAARPSTSSGLPAGASPNAASSVSGLSGMAIALSTAFFGGMLAYML